MRFRSSLALAVVAALVSQPAAASITIDAGGVLRGSFNATSISISSGTVGQSQSPGAPPPFSLTDPEFLDLASGASLTLHTSGDILVLDYAPATLGSIRLQARYVIDSERPSDLDLDLSGLEPTSCSDEDCATAPLSLTRDVVVRFGPSIGNVDLRSDGSILYLTPFAAPEPGSALLAALGSALLVLARRNRLHGC
ncbi:MAG TPA: hypothetical protein VMR86_08735 [Myxococcota bacterium]|nr:hypothetical protein [Myxococcota bacterium]